MLRAAWSRHRLDFRFEAVTSRDRLRWKDTYYIKVWDPTRPECFGLGEAALLRGLSADDRPGYEEMLGRVCRDLPDPCALGEWPSIRMGLETALLDLHNGGKRIVYDSEWAEGRGAMRINGLVWMGSAQQMEERMARKLEDGFSCIKIKIGGIDFGRELEMLARLREMAPGVELRLDANGAFTPAEAPGRLEALARYDIHSIEQPIRQGQWAEMARLVERSPIRIALDEELIGITDRAMRRTMLSMIKPHFIIIKPTLTGGFTASADWIEAAREAGAGWWVTSALESDLGLNAIAQWTATYGPTLPQGLGTGQLFTNNIPSPLTLRGERLSLDPTRRWQIPELEWH